jgi:hypothetical protein
MTHSPYLPPVRLEAERERTVAELSDHFAHDHLDTAEFESRLDRAYRATSLAALEQLKSDLPALPRAATPTEAAVPRAPGVAIAPDHEVADRKVVFALMGGAERKGAWTPPRTLDVLAIMGGVGLDFREARFVDGETQINVAAIMGGVEIIVPPGVRVESSGIGIMGGFESFDQTAEPSAPLLRITGIALMGGVEITQRLPGESADDAKSRRRAERRRLKEERRRLSRGG